MALARGLEPEPPLKDVTGREHTVSRVQPPHPLGGWIPARLPRKPLWDAGDAIVIIVTLVIDDSCHHCYSCTGPRDTAGINTDIPCPIGQVTAITAGVQS